MSIIKCPECGHNVSTMAGTCPSCGVRIEGNLHKCPECGEYYVGEPDVCPQCGYRLPARKSEPKQEPVQIQETPQPKEAPKTEAKTKNHGCGRFGFFTIFLLLLRPSLPSSLHPLCSPSSFSCLRKTQRDRCLNRC